MLQSINTFQMEESPKKKEKKEHKKEEKQREEKKVRDGYTYCILGRK